MAVIGTEADHRRVLSDLLARVRRMTSLADRAADGEAIFRSLAGELLEAEAADEVHVHHLAKPGIAEDLVVVYLFDGEGRVSHLRPVEERSPGVSGVSESGRPFLAVGPRELGASLPANPAIATARSALLVPLAVAGSPEAVIVLIDRHGERFDRPTVDLVTALVDQAAAAVALVRARIEAGTDVVTGVMNHRAMRRRLAEEIARAQRTGGGLACLLIDLDDFKLVNDQHGHQAGDMMLRGVAQALVGEFRAFDRVARYGGDEFVVILPITDLDSAAAAATRALARLSRIAIDGESIGVAASVGVAQWTESMDSAALLRECDSALLASKRTGKGRVTRAA